MLFFFFIIKIHLFVSYYWSHNDFDIIQSENNVFKYSKVKLKGKTVNKSCLGHILSPAMRLRAELPNGRPNSRTNISIVQCV